MKNLDTAKNRVQQQIPHTGLNTAGFGMTTKQWPGLTVLMFPSLDLHGGMISEDAMAKKGYWVVCYKSVSNPAAIPEYAKLAGPALEALGGRVIAGGKPAKTHEAGVDQTVVVVEFEDLEKAIAAYSSELYGPALKALGQAAQRDFRIVEGR